MLIYRFKREGKTVGFKGKYTPTKILQNTVLRPTICGDKFSYQLEIQSSFEKKQSIWTLRSRNAKML